MARCEGCGKEHDTLETLSFVELFNLLIPAMRFACEVGAELNAKAIDEDEEEFVTELALMIERFGDAFEQIRDKLHKQWHQLHPVVGGDNCN